MRSQTFEIATTVSAPADVVWEHATSLEGITWELGPWLRMTVPFGTTASELESSLRARTPPFRIGRSYLLLFGLLPVDWDDLGIIALEPGRHFHEKSTMATMRDWQHERTITPEGNGALVRDRLTFTTRALVPAPIAAAIVRAIFRHRHRRLKQRFG